MGGRVSTLEDACGHAAEHRGSAGAGLDDGGASTAPRTPSRQAPLRREPSRRRRRACVGAQRRCRCARAPPRPPRRRRRSRRAKSVPGSPRRQSWRLTVQRVQLEPKAERCLIRRERLRGQPRTIALADPQLSEDLLKGEARPEAAEEACRPSARCQPTVTPPATLRRTWSPSTAGRRRAPALRGAAGIEHVAGRHNPYADAGDEVIVTRDRERRPVALGQLRAVGRAGGRRRPRARAAGRRAARPTRARPRKVLERTGRAARSRRERQLGHLASAESPHNPLGHVQPARRRTAWRGGARPASLASPVSTAGWRAGRSTRRSARRRGRRRGAARRRLPRRRAKRWPARAEAAVVEQSARLAHARHADGADLASRAPVSARAPPRRRPRTAPRTRSPLRSPSAAKAWWTGHERAPRRRDR